MDKSQINSFQLGLNKDLHDKAFPEGAYTFSLNSINETEEGNFSAISTEKGTTLCGSFPEGFFPNGKIFTGEEHIVFLYNHETQESELGIVKDCVYSSIVRADCLNFSRKIQGTFRIFDGCDRIIYFCDGGNNPDRAFNIDEYLRNPTDNDYINSSGSLDCSLIKLSPDFTVPCITDINIQNTGGNLAPGMYQVFLRYQDSNGNLTTTIAESAKFPIISGYLGGNYNELTGADPANSPITSKSILVTVNNIDESYEYLDIIVGYTSNNATTFYNLPSININSSVAVFIVSSLNSSGTTVVDRGEVSRLLNPYNSSETMAQHDNRLIRANLSSRVIDYTKFQQAANEIQVRYRWNRVLAENSTDDSGSPKTSTYYVDNRSYMRDEIYSLGIVWILNDGTALPAMHIPGREANKRADGSPLPASDVANHPRPKTGVISTNWDTKEIEATSVFGQRKKDYSFLPESDLTPGPGTQYTERWKVWNTAIKDLPSPAFTNGDTYGEGEMAYWESIHEYPPTLDCENKRIFPLGKIRHHKFPDSTLEPHFQRVTSGGGAQQDYIHPIGLKLSNIHPPVEYADEIQGYYIVREKRDDINKTVLDKGIMYVNTYFNFVQNCDRGDIKQYAIQSNVFNRHAFRTKLKHFGSGNLSENRVNIQEGLVPVNSSIDQDCGSMGFTNYEDPTGNCSNDAHTSVKNVLRFIDYDDESQSFHSPKHKFYKDVYPTKSHIKVELKYKANIEGLFCDLNCNDIYDEDNQRVWRRRIAAEFSSYEIPKIGNNHRLIPAYASLDPNTELAQGLLKRHFLNNNQQETLVFELDKGINNVTDNLINNTQGDPNNDGTFGPCTEPDCYTCTTNPSDAQDLGSSSGRASGLYTSVKSYNASMYGQIGNNQYFQASKCIHDKNTSEIIIFGGDVFISKFSFFTSSLSKFCTDKDAGGGIGAGCGAYSTRRGIKCEPCNIDKANKDAAPFTIVKALSTFYVESEINTELRHIDFNLLSEDDNTYWPLFNGTKNQFLAMSNENSQGDLNEQDCESGTGVFMQWNCGTYAKNRYYYNSDYSNERDVKQYSGLDILYDYCKECQEKFPRRITYSEPGYQEEKIDNYRIFLPLSYRDIPPNTGEITNLFVTYDQLFAHTERSLFQIYTKAQNLQTDLSTLYIGTGEFFSIPPKEQINTDYAYGGSIEKFATIVTEFGAFYVDSETSRIFQLGISQNGVQLQEISAIGLRNFFEEDGLKVNIKEYLKSNLTESEYNKISAFLDTHTGIISTYDPRHKRLIITKKEYKFIGGNISEIILPDNSINFSNPLLFEDLSWTMSFSMLSNSWISWHSYKPSFYMNDGNDFYSASKVNIVETGQNPTTTYIHKHNTGSHSTYYNKKYNQIIEFPIFGINTKALSSLMWVGETKVYDITTKQYKTIKDITFTEGQIYTENQSTGTFSIVPKTSDYQNITWSNTSKVAVHTDKNWKLSGLRDLTIDDTSTVMVSNWNDPVFQAAYLTDNYIDKTVNSLLIDYNKSLYELGDLRDKVIYVRLFFKPVGNYKHILFILNSFNNQNVR